jgi:hypothetical protein
MRFLFSPANRRYLLLGSIALTLLAFSTQVLAEVPRAVSLLYFRGGGLEQAVLLEWATASELDTAGYRLERAEAANGTFQTLDQIGIVPAIGDSLQGAEYDAMDGNSVQNGTVYWYKLIEIEFDGTENPVGPISVTAGHQEPTATVASSSTAQSSPTTAGGSAPTATGTPSPTPTGDASTPDSSATTTLPASADGLATAAAERLSLTPSTQEQAAAILAQAGAPGPGTPYPGVPGATLVPPLGTPATNQVYPPAGSEPAALPTEPYPLSVEREDRGGAGQPVVIPTGTLAALIGEVSETLPAQEAELESTSSSSLFLWTGFLAALMIFIAAVVGSIIYFRR